MTQMTYQILRFNMTDKRIRNRDNAFVGVQLTPELLQRVDILAAVMTLNRSQIIRLALIDYLERTTEEL